MTYRTNAAFLIGGSWKWIAWNHAEPNKHAAIATKAREVRAMSWDCGTADHAELARYNHGARS